MRRIPPPGPFPQDQTIALHTKAFLSSTFSKKEVDIIYTKNHFIFFKIAKSTVEYEQHKKKAQQREKVSVTSYNLNDPKLAEIVAAEDDDLDDYDQYIKTWGPDENPCFCGLQCVARRSRKDQLRLVIKEFTPGTFSRNREFKCYLSSVKEVETWVNFINAHNRSGVWDDDDDAGNLHGQ
eukprot:UN04764